MPRQNPDRLLMVYNADEGYFNALNDWAHKFFSPETYECRLCRYTYGLTGMLAPWKLFIESQPFPTVFTYRPKFWEMHPEMRSVPLPVILTEKAGRLEVLLSAEEIKAAGGLEPLIACVRSKLELWHPGPGAPGPAHGTS
ncbi:MAG: hypothetical protein ABIQ12_11890 [Opitutaceae bacterium]